MLGTRCRVLLLAGAAMRLAAYPLPGSTDVPIFGVWSHYAATEGVGRLYGTGGRFPERRVLEYGGVRTKVDYPPLALYELARASPKALALAGDTALACILYVFARRRFAESSAPWAVLVFWLNPAVLLLGSVLGYLDVLYLAPAAAALFCALEGHAILAGALFAAACLTKPLGILVAPAIVFALRDRLGRLVFSAMVAALVIALPVVVAGGFFNMLWGVGSLLHDPFASAAANLWWLTSRAVAAIPLDALRLAGAVMTGLTIAWAAVRLRNAPCDYAAVALAGFSLHAYTVLAVSVHENHLCGAIPFLALVSAADRKFVPVLAAVSTIAAVNMNVFYGFGVGVGWSVPPSIAGVDLMTPLAAGNIAALAWHARILVPHDSR